MKIAATCATGRLGRLVVPRLTVVEVGQLSSRNADYNDPRARGKA